MGDYLPLPPSYSKQEVQLKSRVRVIRPRSFVILSALLLSFYGLFISFERLGYTSFNSVNLYFVPGQVSVVDDGYLKVAHWHPEGRAPPPDYVREILERVRIPIDPAARFASERPAAISLEFARNKTIFLVGDSQERNVIEDFCNTIGKEGARLRIPDLYQTGNLSLDSTDAWPSGRECVIPSVGLRIISVSLHGVQDNPEFWKFKSEVREPTLTWDKIRKMAIALNQADIKVDMILAQSGLWDLATWNIQDALASVPAAEELVQDQIKDYIHGITHMLDEIQADFPHVPLLWRTATYTRSSPGFWFYNGLTNVNLIPRAPYASVKVNQINEAVSDVMRQRGVVLLPWNYILAEQVGHFKDDIHPDHSLNYLYMNTILYHLERITKGSLRSYGSQHIHTARHQVCKQAIALERVIDAGEEHLDFTQAVQRASLLHGTAISYINL